MGLTTHISARTSSVTAEVSRIGPYIFGKKLGEGSAGRVKLGVHVESGQKVAVKIIPREKPGSKEATDKKLEREITIMKLIQHPNVLQLYDVYESAEELFLVMELVEGGELFEYLVKQVRLKEKEALDFFQQIIGGLDYCHKHLICHRDLKPENLLIDGQKNVKLADFGMASFQQAGKLLETSCGSPHYASPEVIKGIKYEGATADIWSCGVILYALLAGCLPFDDENIQKLLRKVRTGVFTIPPVIPPDAADLIKKMLVLEPKQRISLAEIMKHPWFLKQPVRAHPDQSVSIRLPPTQENLLPLSEEELLNLDQDIVKNLKSLGWSDSVMLRAALADAQPNFEKVFYWILSQRKNEYFERYEPEQEWWYEANALQPRRRNGSTNSMYIDRGSMTLGANTSTNELDAPSNSSASTLTDKRKSMPSAADAPASPSPQRKAEVNAVASNRRSVYDQRRSHTPSPLAMESFSSAIDQISLLARLSEQNSKTAALDALNGNRSAAPIIPGPTNGDASPVELNRLQIVTNVSVSAAQAPSPVSSTTPQCIGTPRFHRRKLTLSNPAAEQQNASSASLEILPSPNSVSLAKKSWFSGIFSFKPDNLSFHSPKLIVKVLEDLERLFKIHAIKFQDSPDNSMKCKFEGNTAQPFPLVKFRVNISENDGPDATTVSFILQQGNFPLCQ